MDAELSGGGHSFPRWQDMSIVLAIPLLGGIEDDP